MNSRLKLSRRAAVLACAASMAGAVALAAPIAAAAAPMASAATTCGSKTITVKAKGTTATKVPVSRISVSGGATCREAYAVIEGVVTKELPPGWTVTRGHFQVPRGLTAQVATKGKMTVKFALVGAS